MKFSKLRAFIQLIFIAITAIGLFSGLSILWLLLFGFLTGPIFCGWMCPFGSLQDFMSLIRKKLHLKKINLPGHHTLKYLPYLLFAAMFLNISNFLFEISTYDPRAGFQLFLQFHTLNLFNGIVLFIFLLASLFIDRFFCKYLCIEGAKQSIVSSGRLIKIERTESCINCKKCDQACPMGITLTKDPLVKDIECISCLNCIEACPVKDAIHLTPILLWNRIVASLLIAGVLLIPFLKLHFEEPATPLTEPIEITNVLKEAEKLDRPKEIETLEIPIENEHVQIPTQTQEQTNPLEATIQVEEKPNPLVADTQTTTPIKTEILEGSARGFKGTITVEVKQTGDQIESITVLSHKDDRKWYNRAVIVLEEIVNEQNTDVDTVSGATYSSLGLINAVKDALGQPQREL